MVSLRDIGRMLKKVYRVEKGLLGLKRFTSFEKVYQVEKGLPGCGINRDDFLIEFIWKDSLDIEKIWME